MPDQAATGHTKTGALAGIRILDLTSVVFGPYATQMLGDMGADIIKIESPEGDVMRAASPARHPGMGAVYLNSNRNKRSIVLDLKQQAARDVLIRLVSTADVFVHSMRPQAMTKLRLDYETLKRANPEIIHCSAWGYGSGGPYADKPAYDDIIQAMSGAADLTRRQGLTEEPAFVPAILADKTAGLHVAIALLTAIVHKVRTGRGQSVEVPMFESLASFMLVEHLAGAVFEPAEGPMGYQRLLAPHRKPYRTADGYITVLPYTTKQWRSFFTLANRPEMLDDPRVNDAGLRSRVIGELYQMVAEIMPSRTSADWLEALEQADIPAMPVNSLEDVLADRHLAETGFFREYDHPSEGRIRTPAPPMRFSDSPATIRKGAPRLGEDSRTVLAEAGYSAAEIAGLIDSGAVRRAE
ncbi:CaiB/BaiF CoA transferase family protein [Oceanibaculum indicum]|uniref:Crotonobetainyl-CoA:carnitine CoA-transferase CaiB-like acyl-CoA transferase n=1 Tax=Oceanibaculum indicum TaxID=526216 RepID=A0A420WB70_9PROT|nr:CoA transferase [Oceanibaculum indicum]RKQ68251.1 crotonobetainyl-CoA:carnitine CoA-transferase CaiB-like acyl-CoA transferase [Oceanibaculum indicum]